MSLTGYLAIVALGLGVIVALIVGCCLSTAIPTNWCPLPTWKLFTRGRAQNSRGDGWLLAVATRMSLRIPSMVRGSSGFWMSICPSIKQGYRPITGTRAASPFRRYEDGV